MHKDVMRTIYNYRLDEILKDSQEGKNINPDYVIDTLSIGMSVNHESYVDLADSYKKLSQKYQEAMETILQLRKQSLRDRRIVDLFLRNKGVGLDWEYDRFEARIYDKLYEKGMI